MIAVVNENIAMGTGRIQVVITPQVQLPIHVIPNGELVHI